MDLLNLDEKKAIKSNTLFVDWETVIPSDVESLLEMNKYAKITDQIPANVLFEGAVTKQSLMKKAYFDKLLEINRNLKRPSYDYNSTAREDFIILFTNLLKLNDIKSVLPALSVKQGKETILLRMKTLQVWDYKNGVRSNLGIEEKFNLLRTIEYQDFYDLRNKINEMVYDDNDEPRR